jgi:hypothetical protein
MRKLHKRGCPGNGLFFGGCRLRQRAILNSIDSCQANAHNLPPAGRDSITDLRWPSIRIRPSAPFADCPTNLMASLNSFLESYRLLVNGQDDASGLADDAMPCPRRVDGQSARNGRPILITLGTRKDENMLVTCVLVHRNSSLRTISDQGRRRAGNPISIQTVVFHAVTEGLPRNCVGVLGYFKEIFQLDARIDRGRVRFHKTRRLPPAFLR